jgi:hypothetical protein
VKKKGKSVMDQETVVFSEQLSALLRAAKDNKNTVTYEEIEEYFKELTLKEQDIEKIIRMIKKRKSVRYISEQMGMEEDFAEQICRLYLTHPGVTAEGIMTKMGL